MDLLEPLEGNSRPQELRRSYHDRIAGLRQGSVTVLRSALAGASEATTAFVSGDTSAQNSMRARAAEAARIGAVVDDEVVDLLALESPVARDLRVILAARDVTQISLLCVGLGVTLASRGQAVARVAGPDLRARIEAAGTATAGLLRLATGAWTALDPDTAGEVLARAEGARADQVAFFAALLELTDVPIDAALDLGLSSRAFDRLADHAVEIAERVLFAVHGRHTPVGGL